MVTAKGIIHDSWLLTELLCKSSLSSISSFSLTSICFSSTSSSFIRFDGGMQHQQKCLKYSEKVSNQLLFSVDTVFASLVPLKTIK